MKNFSFLVVAILTVGCSLMGNRVGNDPRPTLVQTKNPDPVEVIPLKKGKFLDYIYEIQPDHKQPGYEISTDTLSKGYAHATGPYDGVFYQFFLFRGKSSDLVIRQTTGYETKENDMAYGSRFEPFLFTRGKMKPLSLADAMPTEKMDAVYAEQIEKIKNDSSKSGWALHRLMKLPEVGTDVELKVCRDKPEPPFATDTICATVALLKWNRKTFRVVEKPEFPLSEEKI